MTFAEADVQYELIKQRRQAGALTDEQYDAQLRELMVQDDLGRWWAKSRENGAWHFYDAGSQVWVAATPPVSTRPASVADVVAHAVPKSSAPAPTSTKSVPNPATPKASAASLPKANSAVPPAAAAKSAATQPASSDPSVPKPKWAAVVPASVTVGARNVQSPRSAAPATGQASASPGNSASRPFAPLPELTGAHKAIYFALSLLVPFLGIVFFLLYRKKPTQADRSAARICLYLGVASLLVVALIVLSVSMVDAATLGVGQ